jgi:putative transposase
MLQQRFGVSERKACRLIGQHRSTQRLDPPVPSENETELRKFLRDFSRKRPRWGWRRAAKQARREAWQVNDKRIQRLWREEGLRVPYRKRKAPLRGIGAEVGAMCPIAPNALWALDFQFDTTEDDRTIKLLNIVDEFTRECPAIVVERSIDADLVVATLERVAFERGAPAFVRFDHGPEFIAQAVADWCRFNDVATVFIDPGSPWQKDVVSYCTSLCWLGQNSPVETAALPFDESGITGSRWVEEPGVAVIGLVTTEHAGSVPGLDGGRAHSEKKGDLGNGEFAGGAKSVAPARELAVAA